MSSSKCATPSREPELTTPDENCENRKPNLITQSLTPDSWPSLRESLGAIPTFTPSKSSTPAGDPFSYYTLSIPKVICTLTVDDEGRVDALLNVLDPTPIPDFKPSRTPTTSLRAAAKEFVPSFGASWATSSDTPTTMSFTPSLPLAEKTNSSSLNPTACTFVSRVTPKMVPDDEVAFPDAREIDAGISQIDAGDFTFNTLYSLQAQVNQPAFIPGGFMMGAQGFPSPSKPLSPDASMFSPTPKSDSMRSTASGAFPMSPIAAKMSSPRETDASTGQAFSLPQSPYMVNGGTRTQSQRELPAPITIPQPPTWNDCNFAADNFRPCIEAAEFTPRMPQVQPMNAHSNGGWVPFVPGQVMPAMVSATTHPAQRNIPPEWLQNEFKKDKLEDMPEPSTLNKTFLPKLLLAMREFFPKPSNDHIEIFLSNPLLKGKTSMDKRLEENLLVRIANPPPDNETRYPSETVPDPENWLPPQPRQYTPRKKRHYQKKKSATTPTPEPPKAKELVEEAVFIKTLRTVLNKVTPENMDKMTTDLKEMGNPWSERFLELAVQHTHASVVTNAAFAPVYASLMRNILPFAIGDIEAFSDRIVGLVRETLNLGGDLDKEPKSGLLLNASTKKVNSVALLAELHMTCIVSAEHIVSLLNDLLEAKSETVKGFREVCLTCFTKMTTITGNKLEMDASEAFGEALGQIEEIKTTGALGSRMRFMLEDLMDLSKNEWSSARMAPEICPQKLDDNLKTYLAAHPDTDIKKIQKAKKKRASGASTPKSKAGTPKSRSGTPRTPKKSKKKKGTKTPRSKPNSPASKTPKSSKSAQVLSGAGERSLQDVRVPGKPAKMSYKLACRTPAQKRADNERDQRIEEIVKGMDCEAIKKFAADKPSWRTPLVQRLLRKWKLAPFRAAIRKIVEALQGPSGSVTPVELAEGFRLCSISHDVFFGKPEPPRERKSLKLEDPILRSPSTKFFPPSPEASPDAILVTPKKQRHPRPLGLSARCSVRVEEEGVLPLDV